MRTKFRTRIYPWWRRSLEHGQRPRKPATPSKSNGSMVLVIQKVFLFKSIFPKYKQNGPTLTNIKVSRIKRPSRSIQNHSPTIFQPCCIQFNEFPIIFDRDWINNLNICICYRWEFNGWSRATCKTDIHKLKVCHPKMPRKQLGVDSKERWHQWVVVPMA